MKTVEENLDLCPSHPLTQLSWSEVFVLMKMKAALQTQRMFSVILILLCTLGHAGRGREVGGGCHG